MKMIGLLLLILSSTSLLGQGDSLGVFENLVGSTWISSGKQLGGHDGKTVKEISWGLDGEIVKVKSYTTDPKTLKFGLRNEGVRIYNVQTQQLEFYEFDKLGGVSKGVIKTEGKSLHYEYEYGGLLLRDSWIYKSKDEYLFRVCSLSEKGECLQTYHEGKFIRQKK